MNDIYLILTVYIAIGILVDIYTRSGCECKGKCTSSTKEKIIEICLIVFLWPFIILYYLFTK